MNLGFLTRDVKIPHRKLLSVIILSSSTLTLCYLFRAYASLILSTPETAQFWVPLGEAIFYISIVLSAVIGSLVSERFSRRKFLFWWIVFGMLSSASLLFFQGILATLILNALLGITFGLGFPACLAFIAESTAVEERARVAGTMILVTLLTLSVVIGADSVFGFSLLEIVGICVALRATGFLALLLDSCDREIGKKRSWRRIFSYRLFAFYLFPWLMFNIANGLLTVIRLGLPLTDEYAATYALGSVLPYGVGGIFAFISGILADRLGRKVPIIIGLVLLGASYTFLGLSTSAFSWLVHLAVSGVAWGFIMVAYLAVPGDLAFKGSKERFYAVGTIFPFIMYMGFSGATVFFGVGAPTTILSTILSIILFVSVIPVLFASETLPENKMRARQLREYLSKVSQRVAESEDENNS